MITGASQGLALRLLKLLQKATEFMVRPGIKKGRTKEAFSLEGFIETISLDVTDASSCAEESGMLSKEGRIDILINNAGFGIAGPIELTSDEGNDSQYETNFSEQ